MQLTRIYTRTGDDGTTGLGDLSRIAKTDTRLAAFADVDEANCTLGLALTFPGLNTEVTTVLQRIQNELFDLGADLCTPLGDSEIGADRLRITQDYLDRLEQDCDRYNAHLAPLRTFILPGGNPAAAALHQARAVIRRAERATWAAIEHYGADVVGGLNCRTATYLNRLSDLIFIVARSTAGSHEVLWVPGGERTLSVTSVGSQADGEPDTEKPLNDS